MARIMVGLWMVRYPLGGNLSWALQWLVGLKKLGHEVYMVEKAGYPDACFDPFRKIMSDDCAYGTDAVHALLGRFGLAESWCFVDWQCKYHGLTRERVETLFATADLYLDVGSHGAWLEEAQSCGATARVDGEPGYTQMKWEAALRNGVPVPRYTHYYSNGANIGTPLSSAPTGGVKWRPLYSPVVTDLFEPRPSKAGDLYTTVMNWQAHGKFEFDGVTYGQKDTEFVKFMNLPGLCPFPFEIGVAGSIPLKQLTQAGWKVRDAHELTVTYDSFVDYIGTSRGEFSACKHGYVALHTGWFSDRSAAYLASGRPVILQETGFSAHLPCGKGLWAVANLEEALEAIKQVEADYDIHSRAARNIAREFLDVSTLKILLAEF